MAREYPNDPEAEMQRLTTRMVQLDRQFNNLFARCFEHPHLAFQKWTQASLNDAHSHEMLKNHLFSLGEMPRDAARKEQAIDASLRIASVFQEYRGLRDRLDELGAINPEHFEGMQRQIHTEPEPWWVTPGSAPTEERDDERQIERDWWRER